MHKTLIILLITFQQVCSYAQTTQEKILPPEPASEYSLSLMPDEPASFKGGNQALSKYLVENLKYPQSAVEAELQGKCYIKFVVTKKGKITGVTVAKKVPGCPECDREAVRVVKKMPKWTPAKIKGKKMNSYYNLPITFTLT